MFLNVGKYSSPMEHLGMLVFFLKGLAEHLHSEYFLIMYK